MKFGAKRVKPSLNRSSTLSSKSLKKDEDYTTYIVIGIIVLLTAGLIYYSYFYQSSSNEVDLFTSIKNMFNSSASSKNIKDLDIIYFMSPNCGWCKKMNQVLGSHLNSLTVIDITSEEGKKVAESMGALQKGTPAFISRTNKTGSVGFKKSIEDLVASLEIKPKQTESPSVSESPSDSEAPEVTQAAQDLQIILFISPGCGWCHKLKDEFSKAGILDMCEVVDVSTDSGKEAVTSVLGEARGFPVIYSRATQKKVTGYRPLIELFNSLK